MGYISSISIDGKGTINDLLKHAKLIKIVKSDKLLVDHLYLIINKTDYKGPLPQENSIVEVRTSAQGKKQEDTDSFYIHKDNNILDNKRLTEIEKAIAKEHGNVIFHGLSVSSNFVSIHQIIEDLEAGPPQHVFKDKTLTEVLEHIKTSLGLKKVIIVHPLKNTKITYFAPNRVHKKPDNTYTKTPLEELGEIFYAVANIRNNTLYFTNKRYSNAAINQTMNLSLEQLQRKEQVKGDFANYNGVEYSYFEGSTTNIKHNHLGIAPFLKLDTVYEKSLAGTYSDSKYDQIQEKELLKLTVSGIRNKLPGYYLQIRKSNALGASDKGIDDIIGHYSVKECVTTYGNQQERNDEHKEAGPSSKKARLEPIWTTSLKLIRITGN